MTKISVYQIDENVTADDKWIGTDVNTYNKTKNFTPRKLATYFNGNQVINTGVDLLYKYFTITPPEERPAGTLSFETEIGPTVDFSDINTFLLSKTTLKGNDISEFLHFLVNSTSLIYKAKNINLFGSYKIVSVDTYFLDPNFFVVTVDFLEGNGFIEEDEDYMISVVELDKTIPIPQLVKETFEYDSSNSFVVANEINNVLQVIVNTTSLHPDAYNYTLPSTVTVINELFAGDVITVVYNYLEEFLEVPNLQRVTSVGNHTTNNIVLDNLPGENGDYTTINTLTDLGTFQSFTSPTDIDYQSEYAGYGMYLNEIYSPTESKEMFVANGIIQSSYTDGDNYTSVLITSDGPTINFERNDIVGQIKIDDLTENITIQFPDKPEGTYTIATTEDVPPFTPSDYDLDEFTNTNTDPFAKISDIPVLGYTPVNKAGDTMLGDLILNRDPSTALGAATKQYVDNLASGINFHEPVHAATTLNLVADYDNGVDGVGATLTAISYGALVVDTHTLTYLQRVLVWQQTDSIKNGIYDLTVVGDGGTYWELTRSSDADNSPPGEIMYGDFTFVQQGATYGGFGFICNTAGIITIGVTPINYVQFNAAQVVTAGYGLQELTPNVISINPLETQEKITLTTTGTTGAATFITNTLNIPTLPQATSSVNGYLTSTDWNTFNGKAPINNPTFTGIPSAPTATAGTNNTQIATTAFTTTAIAGKMNNPSLTASYIPKALTATTIGNSRLLDTGTYLGIETVNTPTKDITLGYQANREIGIEESTNIVVGRDLSINAGRTVNYVPSTGFIRLNLLQVQYYGADSLSNGDILITGNYNIVYKLVSGSPPFVNYGIAPVGGMISIHPTNDNIIYSVSINISTSIYISTNGGVSFSAISGITPRNYIYVKIMPNGDAYATVSGSNDIYKRTGGAGDFIAMGFTARSYKYIISTPSGDAYFPVAGDDIYKINSGTSVLTALGQTFRSWNNGYFLNGDLYIGVAGGASYKQTGLAGNFVLNTLFTYPVAPVGNLMNVTVSKTTNNVYVPAYDSDVWVQYNNGEGTPNLQGGTLKLNAGTGKGSGDSSIEMWTGQVLASGTTMQTSTLRAKINNTGLMTLPSVTNALIEADTTGKAVVTKEYLGLAASFTATGTATTTFTVTIGITQANNTYKVVAFPSNALSAVMFYINNKTTTTFDVVFVTALTGAVAFDWILKP